jgi:hypothetical protein
VAAAFEMSRYTVIRIRERFVSQGLEDALTHRTHPQTRARTLDGEQEAHLIALSCSPSPQGQARWTLRLLASCVVELGHAEQVSYETARRTLKKRTQAVVKSLLMQSLQANAQFVWHMEDVLEVYTRPYDERFPQICMDESGETTDLRQAGRASNAVLHYDGGSSAKLMRQGCIRLKSQGYPQRRTRLPSV